MDTLVVGAGAMGRWFGRALRADGPASTSVTYVDTDEDAAHRAAEEIGGETTSTTEPGEFSLVCIAVPIPAAASAIEAYSPAARDAILDLTGTMAEPVEAMREHAPEKERLSAHPLFAPENEPGNLPVVIDSDGPVIEQVLDLLESRGNEVFETTPTEHDSAMETVQAGAHAAILAYGLTAGEIPERFQTPVSQALAELAGQVTGGESRVYADIQATFAGADAVAAAAADIAEADREQFEQLYEQAKPSTEAEE